jgi:hypothetical protein
LVVIGLITFGRKLGNAPAEGNGNVLKSRLDALEARVESGNAKMSELAGKLTERDFALRDRFLSKEDHALNCAHMHERMERLERDLERLRGFGQR